MEKISFTKRYILALSIIALLSTLAYFNLNKLINIQSDDGKLINLSGQQKILAQQIAFHAIYYKIKNLEKNIDNLEKNHKQILASHMSDKVKKAFFEAPMFLDKKVNLYLHHAKRFHEYRDGRSLTYLLKNSNTLLLAFDKTVNLYLNEAKEHIDTLKRVELFIFLLTLTTLLFEALFIFRPANKNINHKTEELTKEKDYSNAVIESSTNAIVTLDSQFKIRTFNKTAEKIFGYKKDEMLNKNSFDTIVPNKQDFTELGEVKESEAIDKQGNTFPIRISFGRSGDHEGIEIVANIQDISKEKLNDKLLEEQAKFAALGEMIAVIAHQWRQPLAELNFNCMYIKKKLKDSQLVKEAEKNQDIIQFMSETITNFQNFYKQTNNSDFNPVVSIEQALKLVYSTLNLNQIEVQKQIESQNIIYGNPNSLAQVVLSIVQNIIDIIKLRTINNPYIKIKLQDTQKHIILTITDNANGIKVEPIEDIFKPFTSRKTTPSTGIGLYMSKLVIEDKFKGEISAKNVNDGAEFTIKLPY